MKYKYYFRKPKSAIVKDVLTWLAVAGMVCPVRSSKENNSSFDNFNLKRTSETSNGVYVAASSPYFLINLWRNYQKFKKYPKRKLSCAFYRLKKGGYLKIEKRGHQFFVSLTKKGREKAGWLQIDSLEIKRPKRWDKKWRLVIFDISQLKKFFRELFRSKLKELGFCQLQKSVWVHASACRDEIEVLKEFFGLKESEVRLVIAENIGDDEKLKEFFKLK